MPTFDAIALRIKALMRKRKCLMSQVWKESATKGEEGLVEAIEMGLRFGDDSMNLMPEIQKIHDIEYLRAIKNAIRTAKDVSELKTVIEIRSAKTSEVFKTSEV